ncbi:MAG: hypothetical protein GY749_15725 [Desulfobacteraceae bacterium]|nr:hypothetical protein [Desulfobacteraceae bacterium]
MAVLPCPPKPCRITAHFFLRNPDLLVMPFCSRTPSAYDLDTGPPPYAVAEITSPESRSGDTDDKVSLYTGLGIPA